MGRGAFPAGLVKEPIINTMSVGYDNILLSILNDRLEGFRMKTLKFTYWKDGDFYLGYLNDYPDYQTQGMSKEELVANLKDLLVDVESGEVPHVRKVEELVVVE
jgi:predicted RNase H-like HicB family nuclease